MKATIKGKTLRLEMPLFTEAKPSSTGNTNIIGQFSGQLGLSHAGKPLSGTITAYVYPEPREQDSGRQTGIGAEIKGGVLILDVPTQDPRLSSSGKTYLLAFASGGTRTRIGKHEVMLNLNVYYPNAAYVKPAKGAALAAA